MKKILQKLKPWAYIALPVGVIAFFVTFGRIPNVPISYAIEPAYQEIKAGASADIRPLARLESYDFYESFHKFYADSRPASGSRLGFPAQVFDLAKAPSVAGAPTQQNIQSVPGDIPPSPGPDVCH